MTPLGAVLLGVAVFVVLGAAGILALQDRVRRRQRHSRVEQNEDW